jgi:hypothetical protein
MTVKVIQSRVRAGDKTYFPGDFISGLSKKEEKRLVDLGYCEYVDDPKQQQKEPQDPNQNQNDNQNGEENGPNTDHPYV